MEKNSTLVYTGENKSFRYNDGDYTTTGQKVIADGKFVRVDGGNITKGEAFIGSYNHQVEDGEMKNLWMNINEPSEATAFILQINACFAALNTENE